MKETLKVKGMHCKSCEILIKEELEELEGVQATPDYEKEIISIEFDGTHKTLEKIKQKIKEEGYKV